jgi:hypothetical protein
MATVGLAGMLALTGSAEAQSLDSTERVLLAAVTAGAVVALMTAARAAHRHPVVRSVLLAGASGIAFGIASVFTKTVAEDWEHGVTLASLLSVATIAVLATVGTLLSQASYRGAGLAAPLATVTVVNPVIAAAVGLTMFGETFRHGTTGTVLALACGVVAAGGLILLTTERLGGERQETAAAGAAPEGQRQATAVTGEAPSATGTVPARPLPAQPLPSESAPRPLPEPAPAIPAPLTAAPLPASLRGPSQCTPPYTFGPFYSGPFIPMPLPGRHRSRVGS